jgi:hypothetical protein
MSYGNHGAGSEQGPLLQSLIELNQSQVIVEVGVSSATTTNYLCHGAAKTGGKVYGYDIWDVHGLQKQYANGWTAEGCADYLRSQGHNNFELTKIDSATQEWHDLMPKKHPSIDLAFIDGCHSYQGVKNDFDVIYPLMNQGGIIAFHDTLRIDGCRKFVIDLRTKFWDGTFDIVEFPWGNGARRVGITLLVKRTYAVLDLPLDESTELEQDWDGIYAQEEAWYEEELARVKKK